MTTAVEGPKNPRGRASTNGPKAVRLPQMTLAFIGAAAALAATWVALDGAFSIAFGLGALALVALYAAVLVHFGDRHFKYTLVVPSVALLLFVSVLPMAYVIYLSFRHITMLTFRSGGSFAGFENFRALLFDDPLFWDSVLLTLEYVAVNLLLQVLLGLGLALLLNKQFRGRNLVNTVLLIPVMTTPIVVATLWKYLLALHHGGVNTLLGRLFGISPVPWLTNRPIPFLESIPLIGPWLVETLNLHYALLSVTLVNVWQWTPFVFLVLYAGIQALPQDVFEASTIDGASGWQQFRFVTFPMLKPVLTVVVLVRLVDLLKVFDQIWALFGQAPFVRTLNIHIYSLGLITQDYGMGAALSVLASFLTLGLTALFLRLFRSGGGGVATSR